MATAMDEDLEEELDEKDEKSLMCPPRMHKWKLEHCMVCTVCGDCTGYGASCVSSGRPDRVPGGYGHIILVFTEKALIPSSGPVYRHLLYAASTKHLKNINKPP